MKLNICNPVFLFSVPELKSWVKIPEVDGWTLQDIIPAFALCWPSINLVIVAHCDKKKS